MESEKSKPLKLLKVIAECPTTGIEFLIPVDIISLRYYGLQECTHFAFSIEKCPACGDRHPATIFNASP